MPVEDMAALQASEERLRLALSAAGIGLWELDLATNNMHLAPECYSVLQIETFAGNLDAFQELVYAEDQPLIIAALENAISSGAPFAVEIRLFNDKGELRWYANHGLAKYGEDGRALRVIGTLQDINEAQRSYEATRASERRFRQLAENIKEVFWLFDPHEGRMIYVSPAYEEVWGQTCQSLYEYPRTWEEAIHPDDQSRLKAAESSRLTDGYDLEYRIVRPDGEVRWIRDRAFPVRDSDGTVYRVAGVGEDVTRRRELEAQLSQGQRMESIGILAGGVAHDFNNLLTVILSYSSLLQQDLDEETSRECIAEIQNAGHRAAALTRQLLTFSRRAVVESKVIDINVLIIDTVRMLARLLGENIQIMTTLNARRPVRIDQGQLVQVLMNLAVNARGAMPNGGNLRIHTEDGDDISRHSATLKAGPFVSIIMSDTGAGMTAETKAHAFEPFFTTKGIGEGTGMGLAVVHGIVQQSGGHIEIVSSSNHGTTFAIYLPVAEEIPAESPKPPERTPVKGLETILVVEDDESVRRATVRGLRWLGYAVLVAPDGESALKILIERGKDIDLLFTDVVMPGLGGGPLAETARQHAPQAKVIFASGYVADESVRRRVSDGEADFLQKPFTIAEMGARMRETLDR